MLALPMSILRLSNRPSPYCRLGERSCPTRSIIDVAHWEEEPRRAWQSSTRCTVQTKRTDFRLVVDKNFDGCVAEDHALHFPGVSMQSKERSHLMIMLKHILRPMNCRHRYCGKTRHPIVFSLSYTSFPTVFYLIVTRSRDP